MMSTTRSIVPNHDVTQYANDQPTQTQHRGRRRDRRGCGGNDRHWNLTSTPSYKPPRPEVFKYDASFIYAEEEKRRKNIRVNNSNIGNNKLLAYLKTCVISLSC